MTDYRGSKKHEASASLEKHANATSSLRDGCERLQDLGQGWRRRASVHAATTWVTCEYGRKSELGAEETLVNPNKVAAAPVMALMPPLSKGTHEGATGGGPLS